MRGHDLFDSIEIPLLGGICEILRREREKEIRRLAEHQVQMQNELSAYQNAIGSLEEMLRKHTSYMDCPQYRKIQDDVKALLYQLENGKKEEQPNASKQNPAHQSQVGPTSVATPSAPHLPADMESV